MKAAEILKPIAELLGNRAYVAGEDLTYIDFLMLELCEYGQYLSKETFYNENANIEWYVKKMKNLKEIKRYLESGRLDGLKFNNKNAKV